MLASYTWGEFFLFLSGSLFLYYLFVIFFYYSEDLNKLIAGKKLSSNTIAPVVAASTPYHHTKSPIIAETLHVNSYSSDDEELIEETTHTKNIDNDIEDTSDWKDTTTFTMVYKDATVKEEALLESVVVAEAGSESEEDVEEGGIPADDYVEATVEIQKETIAAAKKELTKAVLRKAYFNSSYIALQNTNENAKANTATLLEELQEEGRITATEIAAYTDFVTAAAGDEDIQTLLHTLNT